MTIRLGIIGWPLIKTFSSNIHQTLSEISNIDVTYKKLPIENFTLDIFESLNNNFDGYNITIPHKENIYNLSKELKNVSRSLAVDNIKAVNTVKVDDNIVSLSNTDVDGINQTFEFLNFNINDKHVLILGSGGSAQTAQYTLSENNKVYIVSRNKKDGDLTYSDLNEISGDIEVIINTTPLGMPPYENEKLPISLLNFSKLELFYNFGYGVSKKLTSELPKNVTSIDGTIMLIAQAISSFNIWTGQSIKFNEAYKEILERIDHEN
jgi:shikimate dehydrogenase